MSNELIGDGVVMSRKQSFQYLVIRLLKIRSLYAISVCPVPNKEWQLQNKKQERFQCLNFGVQSFVIQQLLSHIAGYHKLSSESQNALHQHFEQTVLAKNHHLVYEGKICKHLYFLEKGALRGYYTVEGKEISHWFAFEKDFVTSFHSFITGQPAIENVQLLEGCILWAISKESLNQLLQQYHEIERLFRIALEKYYIRLEDRYVNAQFKTAAERYQNLLEQTPHIIERVSLGHIASYLGISQETLSRVRNRI